MNAVVPDVVMGRALVPVNLFGRLARRVADDEGYTPALAERVVDQALAFLAACAVNRGERLSPSGLVDPGWHAFLLHTKDYREFCERIAGRFIDHVPAEAPTGDPEMLSRAVEAIQSAGYRVDSELWMTVGTCSQCHNGCHDDPPPPPTI